MIKILLNSRHIYQPTVFFVFFSFSLQLMRGRTQNAFGATALYKEYNQFSIIAFGRLASCHAAANDIAGDQPKTNLCVWRSWWQMGLGAVQFVWVTLVMMDDLSLSVCDVSTMTSGTVRHVWLLMTVLWQCWVTRSSLTKITDIKQRESNEFPLDIIGCPLNIQTGYKSFLTGLYLFYSHDKGWQISSIWACISDLRMLLWCLVPLMACTLHTVVPETSKADGVPTLCF